MLLLFVLFTLCILSVQCNPDIRKFDLGKLNKRAGQADATEIEINVDDGKQLTATVFPDQSIFASGFGVYTVNPDGYTEKVKLDMNMFFRGYVHGGSGSTVQGAFEGDLLSMSVFDGERQTLQIEPGWRHKLGDNDSVVLYKPSDAVHDDLKPKCPVLRLNVTAPAMSDPLPRHRRSTHDNDELKTCEMLLVADHRYHDEVGDNRMEWTVAQLTNTIRFANHIFKQTPFSSGDASLGSGWGLVIKDIFVHSGASPVMNHYNNADIGSDYSSFLQSFSSEAPLGVNYQHYCLAHLFTYKSFDDGVLGLAYMASPDMFSVGGICSSRTAGMSVNTAFTSLKNNIGMKIPQTQADLVTTHEIGHSWGSPHDERADCTPGSADGGKHIMYPYSVSGLEQNNDIFSACSRSSIGSVLRGKSHMCFKKRRTSHCGNSFVEDKEECDEGEQGGLCCSAECKLKFGAACSPSSELCCTNFCQVATPADQKRCPVAANSCREKFSFCNGQRGCPIAAPLSDGTKCEDDGACMNGVCTDQCALLPKSMKQCICDALEDSCSVCCFDPSSLQCRPLPGNSVLHLKDGRPCPQGYCESGQCKKVSGKTIAKMWNYFKQISINNLAEVMKDNLVAVVIVLSLIIWIPASIIISCLDAKEKKKREEAHDVARAAANFQPIDKDISFADLNPKMRGRNVPVQEMDNRQRLKPRVVMSRNIYHLPSRAGPPTPRFPNPSDNRGFVGDEDFARVDLDRTVRV